MVNMVHAKHPMQLKEQLTKLLGWLQTPAVCHKNSYYMHSKQVFIVSCVCTGGHHAQFSHNAVHNGNEGADEKNPQCVVYLPSRANSLDHFKKIML